MTNVGHGKWRQEHRSPVASRGEGGPNLGPLAPPSVARPTVSAAQTPAAAPEPRTFDCAFERSGLDGVVESGPCRIELSRQTLTVVPEAGTSCTVDLGDVDAFVPSDFAVSLTVHPGEVWRFSKFGRTFEPVVAELLEAWRARTVECLLLRDLDEVARFDAFVCVESQGRTFSGSGEVRLCRSNMAVLPLAFAGSQLRLADVDKVTFDPAVYATTLVSGEARVVVSKLAKRTEEFNQLLRDGMADLASRGAQAVRTMFPFLAAAEIRQACGLLRDGRTAPLRQLCGINPLIEKSLFGNAEDAEMRPYLEHLRSLCVAEESGYGFKIIRPEDRVRDEDENSWPDAGDAGGGFEDTASDDIFRWFFFAIPTDASRKESPRILAWESTARSGRATYLFRVPESQGVAGSVGDAIGWIERALGVLNFRRSPIYLPDEVIQTQERYRRYAIACRKVPELTRLRQSFAGRALHTTPDAWKDQVARIAGLKP